MVLRNVHLKIGCQLWQEEEELMLLESKTFPIDACTIEQFKDIQENVLLILHCNTTY